MKDLPSTHLLGAGTAMCAGCGGLQAIKQGYDILGPNTVFVNAAAAVLEVGGVLQHGVVIAREYGKPCVVGIDRVVSKLHDGQRVEVDGTAGVIRL